MRVQAGLALIVMVAMALGPMLRGVGLVGRDRSDGHGLHIPLRHKAFMEVWPPSTP